MGCASLHGHVAGTAHREGDNMLVHIIATIIVVLVVISLS